MVTRALTPPMPAAIKSAWLVAGTSPKASANAGGRRRRSGWSTAADAPGMTTPGRSASVRNRAGWWRSNAAADGATRAWHAGVVRTRGDHRLHSTHRRWVRPPKQEAVHDAMAEAEERIRRLREARGLEPALGPGCADRVVTAERLLWELAPVVPDHEIQRRYIRASPQGVVSGGYALIARWHTCSRCFACADQAASGFAASGRGRPLYIWSTRDYVVQTDIGPASSHLRRGTAEVRRAGGCLAWPGHRKYPFDGCVKGGYRC